MGQEISHSQYPPDGVLKPGTYRIFNALAGTSIQVSDHDPTKVVAWEQHDGENQQLQQDLKSKENALSRAHKVNEESANLPGQHNVMESLSQQQAETATLQSKMDRVEYLMSQMMGKSGGDTGTSDAD
ncbi:unnamed protein product [Rhizoctonia solani]|uniref:Uncharacterized protein n=1 Tax=Rhizoctonia solani TaxID=456999 RepID=A0A8H2X4Z6_9AGAM|nr:unnamed protein product [Rhizoctonia solani]